MQITPIKNYNSNSNYTNFKAKNVKSYKMFPGRFSRYVYSVASLFPESPKFPYSRIPRPHSFIPSEQSEEIRRTFVANGEQGLTLMYWLQPDCQGKTQFIHDLEARNENIAQTLLNAKPDSYYAGQMLSNIYRFLHKSPYAVTNDKFSDDLLTVAQTLRQKLTDTNAYEGSEANAYLIQNRSELEIINKNSDARIIKELFSDIPASQDRFKSPCPYYRSNVNSTKASGVQQHNVVSINKYPAVQEALRTPCPHYRANTNLNSGTDIANKNFVSKIQNIYDREGSFSLEQIMDIVNYPNFSQIANTKFNVVGEQIGHLIVDAPIESERKATILLVKIFDRLQNIGYSFNAKDDFGTTPLDKAIESENKLVEDFLRLYSQNKNEGFNQI